MLERPETYEEAKIIIKNSPNQEISAHNRRAFKLQIKLVALLSAGVAAGTQALFNDTGTVLAIMPVLGLANLESIGAYLLYLRNMKKIEDGSFFDKKSEAEIMKMANEYVESYNNYKLNESRGKK